MNFDAAMNMKLFYRYYLGFNHLFHRVFIFMREISDMHD